VSSASLSLKKHRTSILVHRKRYFQPSENQGGAQATYTVKGKFVAKAGSVVFELLRSHRSADKQSIFVAAGRLAFDPETAMVIEDKSNEQRIATDSAGLVPYMTMSQLKNEDADTAHTSVNANQTGFDITASYTAADNSGGW
jgi:hypothetical protein